MGKRKKKKKDTRVSFYKDRRYIRGGGLALLFMTLIIALSMVSYFFTWKTDQDKVLKFTWEVFFQKDLGMANWLGRLGAFVSTMLCYWTFGVSSIFMVLIMGRLGLRMIRLEPWPLFFLPLRRMVFAMFFFSLFLSSIFPHSGFSWGGAIGQFMYLWISSFMGSVGLALVILFIILAVLLWVADPEWKDSALFRWPLTPLLATAGGSSAGDSQGPNPQKSSFWSRFVQSSTDVSTGEEKTEKKASAKKDTTTETKETETEILLPDAEQASESRQLSLALDDERVIDPTALKKRKANSKKAPEANPDLEIKKQAEPDPTLQLFEEKEGPRAKEESRSHGIDTLYDPREAMSAYKFPEVELLAEYENSDFEIDKKDLQAQCDKIITTLKNYKIEITKITATIGPTVTLYEVVPAPGIRINKIKNLEDDIALSLSALGIRIIAPIPGKGTVGIEVPNKKRQIVSAKEVLRNSKFQETKMTLPMALGKTISNEVFVADLAKMPHLLVAGATGQGKSVGINQMLISLLYKMHPAEAKLVMIDPKMVELSLYERLEKHFLAMMPGQDEAIITDTAKVIHILNSLCIEMDQRYELLKDASVRNLKEYNKRFTQRRLNPEKGHKFLPYLILVIDEFADLIMTAGKEIELPIARLAQKARAVGIHLIIATQRPSVNIITGMIKANFPARLAFKVQQKVDSRTILDTGGAEQLTGMGDMLLSSYGKVIRLQCAFVDTPEVEKVIDHISAQPSEGEPYWLPDFDGESSKAGEGLRPEDLDEMFEEAGRLVVHSQSGSTSMLQRKLQLGYNRAGRIMDQLEAIGIVGEQRGSKPREVYIETDMELENLIHHFRNNNSQ